MGVTLGGGGPVQEVGFELGPECGLLEPDYSQVKGSGELQGEGLDSDSPEQLLASRGVLLLYF